MSFTVSALTRSTASPRQSRGPGHAEDAGFNMYPKMPESSVEDLEANFDNIILHHP